MAHNIQNILAMSSDDDFVVELMSEGEESDGKSADDFGTPPPGGGVSSGFPVCRNANDGDVVADVCDGVGEAGEDGVCGGGVGVEEAVEDGGRLLVLDGGGGCGLKCGAAAAEGVWSAAELVAVYGGKLCAGVGLKFVEEAEALYGANFGAALGRREVWSTTLAHVVGRLGSVAADVVLGTVLSAVAEEEEGGLGKKKKKKKRKRGIKDDGEETKPAVWGLNTLRRKLFNGGYIGVWREPLGLAAKTVGYAKTVDFCVQFLQHGWAVHVVTKTAHGGGGAERERGLYVERPGQRLNADNTVTLDCIGDKQAKLRYCALSEAYSARSADFSVVYCGERHAEVAGFLGRSY